MGWIADVIPEEPIESQWGNAIRDRTVTPFANAAERSASWANPAPGAFSYLTDTDRVEVYDGALWTVVAGRTGGAWSRAAVQDIPQGSLTMITWDAETLDTDGFLNPASTTVTIPAGLAGIYAISCSIWHTWANNGGLELLDIYVSTSGDWRTADDSSHPTALGLSASMTIYLSAGTQIQVSYLQGTGGSQPVTGRLEVWRVSN